VKQNQLDQHIKHALESIEPEVPAHLWNNIQAGISGGASTAPDPAGVSSQAASAGSGVAGSGALLKIGAAAAVVLGGGMILWQMNSDSAEPAQTVVQQQEQTSHEIQSQSEKPGTEESVAVIPQVEPEQKAEKVESNPAKESVDQTETKSQDTSGDETEMAEETQAAEEKASGPAVVAEKEETTTQTETPNNQSTQPVVSSPAATPRAVGDSPDEVAGQQAKAESDQSTETFVLVEAGILADKVSGEVPLTINFSNMTEAYSYEWDFDNGRHRFEASPTMTFEEPGDYVVRLVVKDEHGNRMTDQMEITAFDVSKLHVPDVITPNGDGLNDAFRVVGYNVTNLSFRIYRLDGSLVYEGSGQNESWDGMDSQNPFGDKYYVEVTAIKSNGEPIKPERKLLHVWRD